MNYLVETVIHVTLTKDELYTIVLSLGKLTDAQDPCMLYEKFEKLYSNLSKE